jgi:hypothetical protein
MKLLEASKAGFSDAEIALMAESSARIEAAGKFWKQVSRGNMSSTGKGVKLWGNYCGPSHGDPTFQTPARDPLDAACKKHDQCYTGAVFTNDNCMCNQQFLNRIMPFLPGGSAHKSECPRRFGHDDRNWLEEFSEETFECPLAAATAAGIFSAEQMTMDCELVEIGPNQGMAPGPKTVRRSQVFNCPQTVVASRDHLYEVSYPDTFHIANNNPETDISELVVTRTDSQDSQAGWGMDLKIYCNGPNALVPAREILIGSNMGSDTKTVTVEDGGWFSTGIPNCPQIVNKFNWVNDAQHPDEFEITQKNGKITARRIDSHEGWGMNLKIECH